MGSVFKAKDLVLNREVAIKFLLPHRLANSVNVRRFHQEAQAAARLDHPGIVRVHEISTTDDGLPFLTMDFVSGKTLAERIASEGQLPVSEVLDIFIVVCNALAHAHNMGVLHRDLKPSNIMVATDSLGKYSVKVLDFGLAKIIANAAASGQDLTQTGQVFGTPSYMSPEQALGEKVDHRADIYALGCTLYEALTATPPYLAETAYAAAVKHQTDKPLKMSEVAFGRKFPEQLEEIVAKLIAKKPEGRYQSMLEVREALLRVKSDSNLGLSAPVPPTSSPRFQVNPRAAGVLTIAIIFCVIGWGLFARHNQRKSERIGAAASPASETVTSLRKDFSEDNKKSVKDFLSLANSSMLEGNGVAATMAYDGALSAMGANSGLRTIEIAQVMAQKAVALTMRSKLEEAEDLYRDSISIYENLDPNSNERYLDMIGLAYVCAKKKRLGEAEELINTARNFFKAKTGDESFEIAYCLEVLGKCRMENQKYDLAISALKAASALMAKITGASSLYSTTVQTELAQTYYLMGKFSAAESVWNHLLKVQDTKEENKMITGTALLGLAKAYASEKQFPEALQKFDQAIDKIQHTPLHGSYIELDTSLRKAKVLIALKRYSYAQQVTREAVDLFSKQSRHQYEKGADAFFTLVHSHPDLGKQSEAESELKQARMLYRQAQPLDQSE